MARMVATVHRTGRQNRHRTDDNRNRDEKKTKTPRKPNENTGGFLMSIRNDPKTRTYHNRDDFFGRNNNRRKHSNSFRSYANCQKAANLQT